MTGNTAQRAAWDAYLTITAGLLPVLQAASWAGVDPEANPRLGAVVIRVRRYAPMWGEHGPMLIAASGSAVRLYRYGDRTGLVELLQVMAQRLYLLSAGRMSPHGPINRRELGGPSHYRSTDRSEGTKGLNDDD